jgi:hypothetical protein
VKVSIWWMGRERDVAVCLMGTFWRRGVSRENGAEIVDVRTFLDLLQATTYTFVRSADYIDACDFFWVCLLQFVQCA